MRASLAISTVVFSLPLLLWPAGAASDQRVEFILDGSGSMWGQAGGEAKISVAKTALKGLIGKLELSPASRVGLTVYGHRRKGDCGDIQQIATLPYGERGKLSEPIDSISPKGKTPIADSLLTVGDTLKGGEEKTSIVLVSDGIETCGKDPCAVAEQLREQYGIDVVIHVVGFGVEEDPEQLQCIARAGGGRFLAAADATELATAFEEVQAEVAQAEPAAEDEPAASDEPAEQPAIARAQSLLTSISVNQPNMEGLPGIDWVGVYDPNHDPTGPMVVHPVQSTEKLGEPMVVGAGTYGIWIQPADGSKKVLLLADLEVSQGESVELDANRLVAAIVMPDPQLHGIELDWVGVYHPKHDPAGPVVVHPVQSTKSFDKPMMVTPGRTYNVWFKPKDGRPVLIAEGLEPEAGQVTVLGQGED